MKFLIKICLIIFIQSVDTACAQAEKKTLEIFDRVVNSIGNNFNGVPKIEIVTSENNPAYFSPKNKTIYIENKVLNIFKDHENFEDIISYLIAHELAHHYLNHGWMRNIDFGYTSTIGNYMIDQNNSNQKKIDEIQADIFGGFYAKIAGYDALSFGKYCLESIYKEYNIPNEIRGYPSLNERIEIVNSNIEKTNELAEIFSIANLYLVIGDYENANNCYVEILNNNFTSREIYNNIGLISLLKSIEILNQGDKNFLFPVYIEQNTYAENKQSRNFVKEDIEKLLKISMEYFDQSIGKDPYYVPALTNKLVVEFILKVIENDLDKEFYKKIESTTNIDNEKVQDLLILHKIYNDKKINERDLVSASEISKINFSIYNKQKNIDDKSEFKLNRYEKIDNENYFWINNFDQRIYISNSRDNLSIKNYNGYTLLKGFKDKNIFTINDTDYLNYINLNKEKLSYQKVFKLNSFSYKLIENENLILKFNQDNLLVEAVLFNQ